MRERLYNQLPERIRNRFRIVYSESVSDGIDIVKNDSGKWGVLKRSLKFGFFPSYDYLVEPEYDSVGFHELSGLILADSYPDGKWNQQENRYRFFSLDGKQLWESPKGTSVTLDKFGNRIICSEQQYGLLDQDFQPLIQPIYGNLRAIGREYFIAEQNGRYGVTDAAGLVILDFSYTEVVNETSATTIIVKNEAGGYFSFDLKQKKLDALPFDKILKPTSNSRGKRSGGRPVVKTIVGYSERKSYSADLEMAAHSGKWGIAEANGKVLIPNEYDYIDCLRSSDFFKVCRGDLNFSELADEPKNLRVVAGAAKWGIVNAQNQVVVPLEYDWIEDVEENIWVVYQGGEVYYNDDFQEDAWTIKGGKLGVYHLEKLIVPVAYDAIHTSWYRVKDYIFVQKGGEVFDLHSKYYEVFSFDGQQISANLPDPRNHFHNS